MNKVILSGRIVKDVEVKHFDQTRTAIINVIAVQRPFSKDQSDFIPFQVWGKLTEVFSKFVKKGDYITLIGSLYTSKFTNNAGVTTYSYNINVTEIEFVPKGTKDVYENGSPKVNNGETPHDAHTLPQSMEKNMEDYGIADSNIQIGDGDLPF